MEDVSPVWARARSSWNIKVEPPRPVSWSTDALRSEVILSKTVLQKLEVIDEDFPNARARDEPEGQSLGSRKLEITTPGSRYEPGSRKAKVTTSRLTVRARPTQREDNQCSSG